MDLCTSLQGNTTDYGELVEKLSSPNMPAQEMSKWLQALKLCACHLDQDCDLLVRATLVSPSSSYTTHFLYIHTTYGGYCPFLVQRLVWFVQSQQLVELYLDYLANLLSAQVSVS